MSRFETKITQDGSVSGSVVAFVGELDIAAAEEAWAALEPLLAPAAVVVLDASALEFLDSSGLRVLARAIRRAGESGASLRLAAPHRAVERVLDLAGAQMLIETFDSVDAALAA
jgi:anti-anti-sigma factor